MAKKNWFQNLLSTSASKKSKKVEMTTPNARFVEDKLKLALQDVSVAADKVVETADTVKNKDFRQLEVSFSEFNQKAAFVFDLAIKAINSDEDAADIATARAAVIAVESKAEVVVRYVQEVTSHSDIPMVTIDRKLQDALNHSANEPVIKALQEEIKAIRVLREKKRAKSQQSSEVSSASQNQVVVKSGSNVSFANLPFDPKAPLTHEIKQLINKASKNQPGSLMPFVLPKQNDPVFIEHLQKLMFQLNKFYPQTKHVDTLQPHPQVEELDGLGDLSALQLVVYKEKEPVSLTEVPALLKGELSSDASSEEQEAVTEASDTLVKFVERASESNVAPVELFEQALNVMGKMAVVALSGAVLSRTPSRTVSTLSVGVIAGVIAKFLYDNYLTQQEQNAVPEEVTEPVRLLLKDVEHAAIERDAVNHRDNLPLTKARGSTAENLVIEDKPVDNSATVSQSGTPSTEDLNVALVTRPASDNVPPVTEIPPLSSNNDSKGKVISAKEFEKMMNDAIEAAALKQVNPERDLKTEYRRLALLYHPDKNPEKKAEFQSLNSAYKNVLSTIDDKMVEFLNAQSNAFRDEIEKIMGTSSPNTDAAVGAYKKLKSAIAEYSRLVGQVKKGWPAQASQDKAKEKIAPLVQEVNKAIEDLKIASENIQMASEDTLTEQSVDESTEVEEESGLSDDDKFYEAGMKYNTMLTEAIEKINAKIDAEVTEEEDRDFFKNQLNTQKGKLEKEILAGLDYAFEPDKTGTTKEVLSQLDTYVEKGLVTLEGNVDATLTVFDNYNHMFAETKEKLSANQQIFTSQVEGQIDVIAGYFLEGLSTAVSFESETSDTLEKCTSYVKESLETLESKVEQVVAAFEVCNTKLTVTTEKINAKSEEYVTTQKKKDYLKKYLSEKISEIKQESVDVLSDLLSDEYSEERVLERITSLQAAIDKALAALSTASESLAEALALGIPSGTVELGKEALLNAKGGPFSKQPPTSSSAPGQKKAGGDAPKRGIHEGIVKERQQALKDAGVGPFSNPSSTSSSASGQKKADNDAQGLGIPSGTVKLGKEALLNAKGGRFSTQSPTSSPASGQKKADDDAQGLGIPSGTVELGKEALLNAKGGPFSTQPPTSSSAPGQKKAGGDAQGLGIPEDTVKREKEAASKGAWIMRGYLPQNTITRLESELARIADEVEALKTDDSSRGAVQAIQDLQASLARTGEEVDELEKSVQHKGSKVKPVERVESDKAIARLIAQRKELEQALKAIQAGLVRAAALKAGPCSAAKYGQQFLSEEKQAQYKKLADEAKAAALKAGPRSAAKYGQPFLSPEKQAQYERLAAEAKAAALKSGQQSTATDKKPFLSPEKQAQYERLAAEAKVTALKSGQQSTATDKKPFLSPEKQAQYERLAAEAKATALKSGQQSTATDKKPFLSPEKQAQYERLAAEAKAAALKSGQQSTATDKKPFLSPEKQAQYERLAAEAKATALKSGQQSTATDKKPFLSPEKQAQYERLAAEAKAAASVTPTPAVPRSETPVETPVPSVETPVPGSDDQDQQQPLVETPVPEFDDQDQQQPLVETPVPGSDDQDQQQPLVETPVPGSDDQDQQQPLVETPVPESDDQDQQQTPVVPRSSSAPPVVIPNLTPFLDRDAAEAQLARLDTLGQTLNSVENYERNTVLPILLQSYYALEASEPASQEVRAKLMVTIKLIDKDFDDTKAPPVVSPRTITNGPGAEPETPLTHLELLKQLDKKLDELLKDQAPNHQISPDVKAGLEALQVVVKHSINVVKIQAPKGVVNELRGSSQNLSAPESSDNPENTDNADNPSPNPQ